MWGVLDDQLVAGVVAAETHLRPARAARFLDVADWNGAVADVTRACQLWGGFADLLVPSDGGVLPEPYARLLYESELDGVVGRTGLIDAALPLELLPHRSTALLALGTTDRELLKELEVCGVRPGNPWELAYLATLGSLPVVPDPAQISALLLRDDLAFDDVVRVRRVSAVAPGSRDLAARLHDPESFTPRGQSLHRLQARAPGTTQAALDGWLQDRYAFARQSGSSIVIVYTPRSVADLCLVWNLRALHGWPPGLPLAVPLAENRATTLDSITDMLAHAGNGIGGWPVMLTSASLDDAELDALAELLHDRHQRAEVVRPHDILRPARAPARTSASTLAFDSGAALVATRTDRDRQDLALLARVRIPPDLRLTVHLPRFPLPPVQSLDGGYSAVFRGGGCVVDASADKLADLRWPSGFTVLRAVAQDRHVDAAPSASGRTAMALLQAIGSLHDVVWLAHRPLLGLLYKKAASSGMSWWKQRASDQAAIVAAATNDPESTVEQLLAAIEDVSVSHGGESAATVTFGELCQAIGQKEAAAAWLEWAERRALLVRGATLRCPRCQHEGWRPLAEIAPPMACPGCGAENSRPFNESAMPFSYRLGEVLRRAIENDSIYHVLVMRTLAQILESSPDRLVGAHPGVDFTRDGQRAEADVVAILASGQVVPAEVKLRSTGLGDHDLRQFELLSEWLDVPTIVLATGDDDAQLAPGFIAAARTAPQPSRRLLTAEDWLAPHPMTTFGTRYPGPDACQDEANPQPRSRIAADYDAEFAGRLLKRAPLDAAEDPTATRLGGST